MIGVILMVAITVILSAVIGVFVLGLGEQVGQTTPQASLGMSDADDSFESPTNGTGAFVLSHNGGDDLEANNLEIVVRNTSSSDVVVRFDTSNGFDDTGLSGLNVTYNGETTPFAGETLQTGDTMSIVSNVSSPGLSSGTKYRIVVVDAPTGRQVASGTITLA